MGTETRDGNLFWNDLHECQFTEQGLLTQALRQQVRLALPHTGTPQTPIDRDGGTDGFPLDAKDITIFPSDAAKPVGGPGIPEGSHSFPAHVMHKQKGWITEARVRLPDQPFNFDVDATYRLSGGAVADKRWASETSLLIISAPGIERVDSAPQAETTSVDEKVIRATIKGEHVTKDHATHESLDRILRQLRDARARNDLSKVERLIAEAKKIMPRNVLFNRERDELHLLEHWARGRREVVTQEQMARLRSRTASQNVSSPLRDSLSGLITEMRGAKRAGDTEQMSELLPRAKRLLKEAPSVGFGFERKKIDEYERWLRKVILPIWHE
ncbi:hypothetical protein [Sphaerisporangium perillae]|uniref:hypothetical protein n=1 Tax=Sphaerisporangium perillae TaxID=2935860 RepID=UPI00200EEC8C|nr:hypothetical protein [Sphaerisporangium perillae]